MWKHQSLIWYSKRTENFLIKNFSIWRCAKYSKVLSLEDEMKLKSKKNDVVVQERRNKLNQITAELVKPGNRISLKCNSTLDRSFFAQHFFNSMTVFHHENFRLLWKMKSGGKLLMLERELFEFVKYRFSKAVFECKSWIP